MAKISVKMQGLDTLMKAIKDKIKNEPSVLQRAVMHHGAQLQQKAMRAAPVKTGNLKRSIMLDISYNGLVATVEPQANYAPYVEYGTRFMNAQPFMRPSYYSQVALFKSDIQKLVK